MTGRDNELWQQSWRDRQIDFHQIATNAHLVRFWSGLGLAPTDRIFVPLCGKSLDLLWLADPVAKSIACLIERIESMEKELAELRHEPPPADHDAEYRTCSAGDLCCEHEAMH